MFRAWFQSSCSKVLLPLCLSLLVGCASTPPASEPVVAPKSAQPTLTKPSQASMLAPAPQPKHSEPAPVITPSAVKVPAKSSPVEPVKTPSVKQFAPKLPALLQEVEKKYSSVRTLKAQFTQVKEIASLGTKKESRGSILLKRPDKVRWETTQPEASLLVSDGKKFWFYTPPFDEGENGQLIIRAPSKVQTRLASALLAGSFSLAQDMTFDQESESSFMLYPKPGTNPGLISARIHVELKSKLVDEVTLEHRGGNRTFVTLSDIELGADAAESQFFFEAPKNTEIIQE